VSSASAFTDELTGNDTRYLFMSHGKLLSTAYLFQAPLARACAQANLVDAADRPTVSSHRFRHTVGTQLAERGARLQTSGGVRQRARSRSSA
jgi:site-specific recombinase XerD